MADVGGDGLLLEVEVAGEGCSSLGLSAFSLESVATGESESRGDSGASSPETTAEELRDMAFDKKSV